MKSNFIVLEGLDGCGKTTVAKLLAKALEERGKKVILTREPGGTKLGQQVRNILLNNDTVIDPLTEAYLFAADRNEHVKTLIKPALDAGYTVISDRYVDSSIAYQGEGMGLASVLISGINRAAVGGVNPDVKIYIKTPLGVCEERRGSRKDDRIEERDQEYHLRAKQYYDTQVLISADWIEVDGTLSPQEIVKDILNKIDQ